MIEIAFIENYLESENIFSWEKYFMFYLRSIGGEFRWSLAHVYPAFSVRYSL